MSAIIPIFIPHVGCPHDCVFCNQKKIAGTLSAPSGAEVSDIIEKSLKNCGDGAEIAFYGGSFTAIPMPQMKEYLSAAKRFINEGRLSGIRLSTRPDCIDEEILSVLSGFCVKTIELGCQSMCDDVLAKSGRGHTSAHVRAAARLIKDRGFKLILQMMTHLPGSDREKDIQTARELISLSPDGVRVYPTVVVRDTALEVLWRRGEYIACTPDEAAELGAEIIELFEERSIPIIRFGLNPTDDLSGGEALAGAYHPALGEMAQSARYLKLCEDEIEKKGLERAESITVRVSPRCISAAVGQKRINKEKLCKKYGFSAVKVQGDERIPETSVFVESGTN